MRGGIALVVAGAILGCSAAAHAEQAAVRLAWSAPTGCPDEGRIRSQVEELLGRPLDSPRNGAVAARGMVTREGGRYRLHLAIASGGSEGVRTVDDASCARLGQAAAQILELAIEEHASQEPPSEPGPEASPPAPPPFPPPAPAAPPERPRPEERAPSARAHITASVGGGIDTSALPRPSPGVQGALGVDRGPLHVEGYFAYWAAERETLPGNMGGDFWLAAAGLRACVSVLHVPLRVGPCAAVEAGTLVAHGFGVTNPGGGSELWLAPSGGLEAAYRVAPRTSAVATVDAAVPLAQRTFLLQNVGTVYRPPGVTARLALSIRFEVW